ncbi:hypothetical protein ACP4OV_002758 [Aristida adscensionis]
MAAVSPSPAALLLRPLPRRLAPDAVAVSVVPRRAARVGLRGSWHCYPSARNFHGFENAISLWRGQNKQALYATKQSSSSDDNSSSSDGPPVLTIVAGVIVFLLVLWVIGSVITWIVGLAFGAAKS